MKLVVLFTTGDGCTWSQDHVVPVECESAEKLLVDFEAEVMRAAAQRELEQQEYERFSKGYMKLRSNAKSTEEDWAALLSSRSSYDTNVNFLGKSWALSTFYDHVNKEPFTIDILTLDEWFARNAVTA